MNDATYLTSECPACQGTGVAYDPTLADKVAASGVTTIACSHCRGAKVVRKVRAVVEAAARDDARAVARRVAAETERSATPDADTLPDWML